MKKWTALFLGLLLAFGRTAAAAEAAEPQIEEAVILADRVPAITAILSRGDTVNVVGEYDEDYYVIETESGYGLVEKILLSMPDDPSYEAWKGYCKGSKNLYDNYRLSGKPVKTLSTNARIEVLDELEDGCCVVKVGERTGFMNLKDISKSPIQTYSYDYGGAPASGGGGGAPAAGNDGGEITLSRSEGVILSGVVMLNSIEWEETVAGEATVKADGAEVVLRHFDREEIVQILPEPDEEWEDYITVLVEDVQTHVQASLLRKAGEEPYQEWDGYAKKDTVLYDNFYLQGKGKTLSTNTKIHVVADLETCYLVTVNEEFGYIGKTMVSKTRTVVYTDPWQSGGGGSSSGGGTTGRQEWSDPVL